jgi:hypothetical protein
MDLLTTYTHHSELKAITAQPLISTIHNSQFTVALAKPFPACCVLTSRSLITASNSEISLASQAQAHSSQTPLRNSLSTELSSKSMSKSKSDLHYDWRFTASQFVLSSSTLRFTIRVSSTESLRR